MKQWQVGEFRLSNTTLPEAQRAKIADTAETAVLSVTCASLLFFFFFYSSFWSEFNSSWRHLTAPVSQWDQKHQTVDAGQVFYTS